MLMLAFYLGDRDFGVLFRFGLLFRWASLVIIHAAAVGRLAWLRPGTFKAVCQAAMYAVPALTANERITIAMPAWLSNWQRSS